MLMAIIQSALCRLIYWYLTIWISVEEITVGSNAVINLSMVEDIIGLDEVVVTGYGVQKKSDLTGAVASVSNETLTEMPAVGVSQHYRVGHRV